MRPPANVDADDDHNGDAADLAVWHMPFSSSPTIVASASHRFTDGIAPGERGATATLLY